jgi:predicted esterase
MKAQYIGKIGRDCESMGAVVIETGYFYSGSGVESFGGAKQWPRLRATVQFQEGEDDKAEQLAEELEQWLRDKGVITK